MGIDHHRFEHCWGLLGKPSLFLGMVGSMCGFGGVRI